MEVPEYAHATLDGDGVELFDLESQNAAIVAGDFTLSVTYHLTKGMPMRLNPLSSPYSSGGEVIYVRVESNVTGCLALLP